MLILRTNYLQIYNSMMKRPKKNKKNSPDPYTHILIYSMLYSIIRLSLINYTPDHLVFDSLHSGLAFLLKSRKKTELVWGNFGPMDIGVCPVPTLVPKSRSRLISGVMVRALFIERISWTLPRVNIHRWARN